MEKEQETLPLYAAELNEEDLESGLIRVSIVRDPAIESNFVALSKLKVALSKDLEKGTVTGALLIPDKKILRYDSDTGNYYNLTFSKETIERLRNKFHKDQLTSEVNLEHTDRASDIYLIESWIIESEEDKTRSMGLDELPIGTWVATYKVENDEVLEQIKLGEFKGFSIEAYLEKTIIKMEKQVEQAELEKPKGIKSLLSRILSLAVVNGLLPGTEVDSPDVVEETPVEIPEADPIATLIDQVKMLWNEIEALKQENQALYAKIDAMTEPKEEEAMESVEEAEQPAEEPSEDVISKEEVEALKIELAKLKEGDSASRINVNTPSQSELPNWKLYAAKLGKLNK